MTSFADFLRTSWKVFFWVEIRSLNQALIFADFSKVLRTSAEFFPPYPQGGRTHAPRPDGLGLGFPTVRIC